jgi:hypothetical protein
VHFLRFWMSGPVAGGMQCMSSLPPLICFACIYTLGRDHIHLSQSRLLDWFDPLYLSAISQFTIGYGDLSPMSWLGAVVCVQGLLAVILLVLRIARFVAQLKRDISLDEQLATGNPSPPSSVPSETPNSGEPLSLTDEHPTA